MEIDMFVEKFAELMNLNDAIPMNESTIFKDLEDWSSLNALYVIMMADEDYNVQIRREDIRDANTIGDIYHIIQSRKVV